MAWGFFVGILMLAITNADSLIMAYDYQQMIEINHFLPPLITMANISQGLISHTKHLWLGTHNHGWTSGAAISVRCHCFVGRCFIEKLQTLTNRENDHHQPSSFPFYCYYPLLMVNIDPLLLYNGSLSSPIIPIIDA